MSVKPVAIAVDPSGQFVLTVNGTSANTVSVFRIGSTGTLAQVAGSPFASGADPSAIVFAPGHYVYVANTAGNSVSAYSMDPASGALTLVVGSPFSTGAWSPNGLVADLAGTHLYASESQQPTGNAVAGFAINASTGALTAIPGSPFASSWPISSPVMDSAGVRMHGVNGIEVDCFQIDPSSGALSELGLSATNGLAIAMALDGPDNYLYVLDNVHNQIEVFSINNAFLNLISGSPFTLFPNAVTQTTLGPNAIAVQH
jgi:6-phosphogluconolactonase (cycloisomerase 2 family)